MKERLSFGGIREKGDSPEDFLDQFIFDMREDIAEAEQATRKMIVEEKLLLKRIRNAKEKLEKRQKQALEALELGKEDLARRALEDKNLIAQEIKQLESLYESTSRQVNQLREKVKELKAYYQDLQLKRDAFKTKSTAADVTTELYQLKTSTSTGENNAALPSTDEVEMELKKLKDMINKNK
ncbi:phage shock protein A [Evansella vedderi]|uniref:Phage shock protein A n=1 Tax=Evansella vedderi TaxID=38282 RepID=A0ABT9ZXG5_9BACI|nr:PspA/IM30 family protein [Evansella vedderi]MDQ0255928.1 phage shock protein A [Evansella vedderi]